MKSPLAKMARMKLALKLLGALGVATIGMGANCPGGAQSKANFSNTRLSSSFSSSSTKSWDSAQIVDLGAVDVSSSCLRHNHNQPLTALAGRSIWQQPMAVFSDATASFGVAFNREDYEQNVVSCPSGGLTSMNAYTTYNTDITATETWISSYGNFTQLDGSVYAHTGTALDNRGTAEDSIKPMAVVDSAGNTTLVYLGYVDVDDDGTADTRVPVGSRHVSGNGGAWSAPQILTQLASDGAANDVSTAAAVAVDASDNVVVAYEQNGDVFFNQYRSFLGWRFTGNAFPAEAIWNDAAHTTVNRGVALGFDSYGNGYGVYATAASLYAARWRSDQADNFDNTVSSNLTAGVVVGAEHGYPKIYVGADGSATVFYMASMAAGVGNLICTSTAANSASSLGTFTAGTTFSTGIVASEGSDHLGPIVASKRSGSTSKGALGFIKTGVLYVYKAPTTASCSGWTALNSFSSYGTVKWADLAVNSSGDIAVAFAIQTTGGFEQVYGSIYTASTNSWSTVTRLDNDSSFTPATSGTVNGRTRPSVVIDESGNAVASYTKLDAGYALGNRRRAVISSYH